MKKLKALKPNKSSGLDRHHPYVLKELAGELAKPLSIVFQKSMSEGFLPQFWKDASITSIFKKARKSAPGNYQPVSLTSTVCTLMGVTSERPHGCTCDGKWAAYQFSAWIHQRKVMCY